MKRTFGQTRRLLWVAALVSVSSAVLISGTAHRAQAREIDRAELINRQATRREDERPPAPRAPARPPVSVATARPPVPREDVRREEVRRETVRREAVPQPPRPAARRIRE
ncbi:MAG: hypothetical protein AAFY72_02340 [Cyanobacteria bacterium J06649_4]